jgi:hypothetical protein
MHARNHAILFEAGCIHLALKRLRREIANVWK